MATLVRGYLGKGAAIIAAHKFLSVIFIYILGRIIFRVSENFWFSTFGSPILAIAVVASAISIVDIIVTADGDSFVGKIKGRIVQTEFYKTLKEAILVFFGIDEEDDGTEAAEKAAKAAEKGTAYWISDYALTAASPTTVALLKWLSWTETNILVVMWIEDLIIAYGFVWFSRNVVEDFTMTEALRNSVEVVLRKSRWIGVILSALILIRFSVWDGPERVVIFFYRELVGKRIKEFIILVVFSAVQALFWTKLYSLGIDDLVKMWKMFF